MRFPAVPVLRAIMRSAATRADRDAAVAFALSPRHNSTSQGGTIGSLCRYRRFEDREPRETLVGYGLSVD